MRITKKDLYLDQAIVWFKQGMSQSEIARKIGITKQAVSLWFQELEISIDYETKKKMKKANCMRLLGHSQKEISASLGLPEEVLCSWFANFADENQTNRPMSGKKSGRKAGPSSDPGNNQAAESMEQKLARLEKELAYHKLRADAYDEMINVAEGKFNIPIRKKAGAKQ